MLSEKIKSRIMEFLKAAAAQKSKDKEKDGLKMIFEQIDKTYGIGEAAEYGLPADAELEQAAKQGFYDYYNKNIQNINDKTVKAYAALEEDRQYADKKLGQARLAADEARGERLRELGAKTIRQGIAKSSIADISREDIEKQTQSAKDAAHSEHARIINDIQKQIDALEEQKQNALAELDGEYAQKTESRLRELKEQRDKQLEKLEKENKKQKDAAMLFAKEEKLAEAKKYYGSMSNSDAIKHLKSNEYLKQHLGDYYDYLLNYLKNRPNK